MLTKNKKHGKKQIQVQVDQNLADDTEIVLNELGLTPTTVINVLFKRIVATGALPFNIALTEREKATLGFLKETADIPQHTFKDAQAVEKWLSNENKDE